ncbi:MAG: hypothetical protein D6786_00270 [Gammaproteobacteria bacterium]|nr:MAG: hypothetical protein D6786_00270 [Gammaproteobacteria bacterium]
MTNQEEQMNEPEQKAGAEGSEGQLIEAAPEGEPASRAALRKAIIGGAVVALLIAAGWISGYLALRNDVSALRQGLAGMEQKLEQGLDRQRQAAAVLEDRQARLDSRIGELTGELEALRNKVAELGRQQTRDPEDWVLAEANYLVTLAGQRLLVAGDVAAAERALEAADRRLAELARPDLTPVRQALQQDLEALRAVPRVDLTGMALSLGEAIASVEKLPLKGVVRQPRSARVEGEAEAGTRQEDRDWKALLRGAWEELKGLVVIRREQVTDAALLAPERVDFLYQNLRLELEAARLAVLRRDTANLRRSLATAEGILERFFDPDSPAVQALRQRLAAMRGQELAPPLPDLSRSRSALREYLLRQQRQGA